MHTFDRVNQFLETAHNRADNRIDIQSSNILRNSIASSWYRYYEFLQIILNRYTEANLAYMTANEQLVKAIKESSDGEIFERLHRLSALQPTLHLEIESFYLFARILLDRIADTFAYYFNHPWQSAGSTHTRLTKRFMGICREKSLAGAPDDVHALMNDLHGRIGAYRNDFIEHPSEPRLMKATSWDADKKTQIASTLVYPSDDEGGSALNTTRTGDIIELLGILNRYIAAMIRFFEANMEGSVLMTNVPKPV